MLDFSTQPEIPNYEIKLRTGETKSYDGLILSFKLRALDGVQEPEQIQAIVNEVLEIDVTALDAMLILEDITGFAEKHLEGPLKKVLGREPSSTTSTVSRPKSSETSVQQNSSD